LEDIILYALPVFALLIVAEFAYGYATRHNTYRLNDSISSLSQGLISQCTALCSQFLQVGLYTLVQHKVGWTRGVAWWGTLWGWVAAVVLFDFCDYWLHRVGHERAIFWAAHVVHHQSQEFNFTTALRQESAVPLLGWAFYLPMALLGVPPGQFVAAGLIVLIYQFWIHTEHIGKLGWFDRVFSSPSNHRVHHAINPQYVNKNYGGMLVVWDRLFGTFAPEREACVYGTQTPLARWNPGAALTQVYASLAADALHARDWRDKLRIWFMPTGWRPPDLQRTHPRPAFDLACVRRFDPPLDRAQATFAVLGLLAMIIATAALLARIDALSGTRAVAACLGICAVLWAVGVAMEDRQRLVRCIAMACAAAAAVAGSFVA
jgi:sterol desaturase/sphingolipid hydroxylase (fatty acid hydroxylase superfamily)